MTGTSDGALMSTTAECSGVHPSLSRAWMSAPKSNSISTTTDGSHQFPTALCSGVSPSLSLASMSPPRSSRVKITDGSSFLAAARCSGVPPSSSWAWMSAPRSSRVKITESAPALALGNPVQPRLGPAASHSIPSLTAPSATDPPPANRRSRPTRASPLRDGLLLHAVPPISPSAAAVVRHWRPERQLPTATGPICWNRARTIALPCPSPFVPTPRPHRIGGFGFRQELSSSLDYLFN